MLASSGALARVRRPESKRHRSDISWSGGLRCFDGAPTPHLGSTQFHSAVQNFAHFPVLGLLTVLLLTKLQSQFM